MIITSFVIILLYLFLIGSFVVGFDKIKNFSLKDIPSKTKFTIIIPFRNEAKNLPNLLKSIHDLEYPKHLYEIILVDDVSNDDSVEIINTFSQSENPQVNIKIIKNQRLTNSPKKDAITSAIKQSKYEWIITTDADCTLPKYWLDTFNEFIQKNNPKCIVAPVTYHSTNSFLKRFQLLDILSLQGATIGAFGINKPFMCNGANFAYKKALFKELNGFKGNTNIASGDDIFFLEKVLKAYPKNLHYLKSPQAVVITKPEQSWRKLIEQRLRWASKTSAYNNWFGKLTGLIVLLINAMIIILSMFSILGIFNFKHLAYVLVIKFSIDVLLIFKTARFFNQSEALLNYPIAFMVYPFFSVYIAFLSIFKNYKWKGRTFKK